MKTASQAIIDRGLAEKAELRKLRAALTRRARRPDLRTYPGQPHKEYVSVRYGPLEAGDNYANHHEIGYSVARAQNDLFRIAAAPNATAEYVQIYLTRNHLK